MKKYLIFTAVFAIMAVAQLAVLADARAQEEAQESPVLFEIARMVIAGSIEEREPVGVVNAFAATTEKVYCFLEAREIVEDTTVNFVWYFEEKEVANVELPVTQGSRWRTYSSKKLAGLKGNWKVELHDIYGNVLQTVEFYVE